MNFLAHVYLSGNDLELAMGNLIADRIKGNRLWQCSAKIQEGILLHRAIDLYTDAHPNFKQCAKKLFATHRHYGRVLVDMFFDHFLAKNWNDYHAETLSEFSERFYVYLKENQKQLPADCQSLVKHLMAQNWFGAYESLDGLEKILRQMERRTQFESNLASGRLVLSENYSFFESQFKSFFSDITSNFNLVSKCFD